MIQDILTYSLIIFALSFTAIKLYQKIFPKKNHIVSSPCAGCSGCKLKGSMHADSCENFHKIKV